jgi:hypothetical protein
MIKTKLRNVASGRMWEAHFRPDERRRLELERPSPFFVKFCVALVFKDVWRQCLWPKQISIQQPAHRIALVPPKSLLVATSSVTT